MKSAHQACPNTKQITFGCCKLVAHFLFLEKHAALDMYSMEAALHLRW